MESRIVSDISSSSATPPLEIVKGTDPFKKAEEAAYHKQLEVEQYNRNIGTIHESFKTKQLIGAKVVVRLFKYDYIQPPAEGLISRPAVRPDMKLKMFKNRDPHSGQAYGSPIYVDNPLPYMYQGVICQVPKSENFTKAYPELTEGSVVETGFFQITQAIYYPDKQTMDSSIPDSEVIEGKNPVPNFQGYVLISPGDITHVHNEKVTLTYQSPEEEVKGKERLKKAVDEFKKVYESTKEAIIS